MLEADGGKCFFLAEGLHDRPSVISEKSREVQNCNEAVGIDDLKPLIPHASDAFDWRFHVSGSIFTKASTVSHPDFVMVSPTGRTAIIFEPDDSYSVVDLMLMNEFDVPPPKAAG